MTEPPRYDVFLKEQLLYHDRGWIHVVGGRGKPITAEDAALLDRVFRGECDLGVLSQELSAELGTTPAQVSEYLARSLRDPRSVLCLREHVPVLEPDVIVCEFGASGGPFVGRGLVRRLRRTRQVLHLGLDHRVQGPPEQNLSLGIARRYGYADSWYEFSQWCRAIVRRHVRAVLVLCGAQDAVLFGDLVRNRPALVLLDPEWPSLSGPRDLIGAAWVPEEPLEAVRALIYALRFSPVEDVHLLHRAMGSHFAALEGYALRHATTVAYDMVDQPGLLGELGRDPSSNRLVLRHPLVVGETAAPERVLVLAAGLEEGAAPIAPFLHALQAIPPEHRAYDAVAILGPQQWWRVQERDDGGSIVAWSGPRPTRASLVAAFAFPGLLRCARPALQLLEAGVPTVLVPCDAAHPLLDGVAPELVLQELDPRALADLVRRLCDPADPYRRHVLESQRERVEPLALRHLVAEVERTASREHVA